MSVLRLVPVIGDDLVVDQDRAVVGREPTCDVVIEHGSVSRKHALLERRADGWFVTDQGSANGTFLDGARVADGALRQGQELRFGAATFRVQLSAGEGAEATLLTSSPEATVMTPVSPDTRPVAAPPPRPAAPPPVPAAPAAARPAAPPPVPPRAPTPPAAPAGAPPPVPPPVPPRAAGPPPVPPRSSPPPPAGTPRPPLGAGAAAPRVGDAAAPARKGKSPFFWMAAGCSGCLLLVLIGVGVIAGGAWWMTSGATDVIKAQLGDLRAGRLDAAYDKLSADYRATVTREAFATFVGRHPALKDNADATFMSRSVHNDRAQVSGTLKAGSGITEAASYRLSKEGGHWVIDEMDVEGDRPGRENIAQAGGAASIGPVKLQAQVGKTREGGEVRVLIRAEASGFAVRPEGGQFAYDLAYDVETVGPDGQPMPDLTREEVERYQGRTSLAQGAVYPFERTLTLDPSLPPGAYTVRLTVRDMVGGGRSSRELRFEMP
jgi:hypothetical protein